MNPPTEISESDIQLLSSMPAKYQAIELELGKRIIGQQQIIRDLFVALMVQGHVLMIGVPGLAKTLLVKSLGEVLDLPFGRVQFTPDLMPSDITGTEIIEEDSQGGRNFRCIQGPIFTSLLLADEINRTPPKTQAALLEAMQERRVTIAGKTYDLPSPFFVMATQNPIEQEGTYPLPEAQLDRFMFNIHIGYPEQKDEVQILLQTTVGHQETVNKMMTGDELLQIQRCVRQIDVPMSVAEYAVNLVCSTRPESPVSPRFIKRYIQWGAGPRASQYLALAGKALAVLDGRFNVAKEDIQRAAKLVLRHRLITNYRAEADHISIDEIITHLVNKTEPAARPPRPPSAT